MPLFMGSRVPLSILGVSRVGPLVPPLALALMGLITALMLVVVYLGLI